MINKMKFYTNEYQNNYKTISSLENSNRIKEIIDYLKTINKIRSINTFEYEKLYNGLPDNCKYYIDKILKNINNTKLINCIICSWNNELENGKIICEICNYDISNINSRYGYFNSKNTDTSIHANTKDIIQNTLSCIEQMLNENIVDNNLINDIMLITRPPGHHSSIGSIEGFCYLNWTYIISEYFINIGKKICIIDLDLHHGNGTQEMVKDNESILFIDFHYFNSWFYPKTGDEAVFIANNVVNVNMKHGSDDSSYLDKIKEKYSIIEEFSPDLFIISMGCDIISKDNFNIMNCSTSFYKSFYDIMKEKYSKEMIFVLEGGYNSNNITNTIKKFI